MLFFLDVKEKSEIKPVTHKTFENIGLININLVRT